MSDKSSKTETYIANAGEILNNVTLPTSNEFNPSDYMTFLLAVNCVIKVIEFIFFIYKLHMRTIKKKYDINNKA